MKYTIIAVLAFKVWPAAHIADKMKVEVKHNESKN